MQVGLSLALVVAAGLFVRTFQSLSSVPLGIRAEPLLVVTLDLRRSEMLAPGVTARGPERRLLFEQLRETAAAVPGVKSAALSRVQLLTGGGWSNRIDLADGEKGRPGIRNPWLNGVTPGWFQTHGLRLIAGRDFTLDDRLGGPVVAVVNEAFVRRYFQDRQPDRTTLPARSARSGADRYRDRRRRLRQRVCQHPRRLTGDRVPRVRPVAKRWIRR